MPKKFTGKNTKADAALKKKTASKDAQLAKKKLEIEEAFWHDNNKQTIMKQQKKEDQLNRKKTLQDKKAETKIQLEKELEATKKPSKLIAPKVTRVQIQQANQQKSKIPQQTKKPVPSLYPLEENINRAMVDTEVARTVTDAIAILQEKDVVDKHPEKRMKAAYASYEERRLKLLKLQNPTLKQSQLKQMIYKEWQKSPENPLKKAIFSV